MSAHLVLQGIVVVIALGIAAQWLAWRFRLPSILLLLVFGFVAGPVTGVLSPEALQGEWVFAFASLAIGIILFEGGLTLRLSELKEVGKPVRNLTTVGVLVTWAGAAAGAYYLVGFTPVLALLVGAILIVTGPTVVGPLLRHVRPKGRVGTIAKWEGITIDPIGAITAVLVFEAILLFNEPGHDAAGTTEAIMHTGEGLLTVIVVGVGISVLGASALVLLIRRGLLPDHLLNVLSLMIVVVAFALSNMLYKESGLLTTTLMGILMANQSYVPVWRIGEFKEDLQVLLIACLFIVLSARLELSALSYLNTGVLLFLAVLVLVVRPLAVWASSWGTRLNWREWAFLSWLAPRGIVAAAVASLFALRLEEFFPAAQVDRLVPVVFLMIVGTAAIYGLTLAPVARWLGLAQPSPQGVLVVGARPCARKIARAIEALGFDVLVADSNARNIEEARAEGLRAEQVDALNEHLVEDLDLAGIGRLMAMTTSNEVNALVALYFREFFESAQVYQLSAHPGHQRGQEEKPARQDVDARSGQAEDGQMPRHLRGRPLFGQGITYDTLSDRFEEGGRLRVFEITESRSLIDIEEHYEEGEVTPLFLDCNGDLVIFSAEARVRPRPGDRLVALVPPLAEGAEEWEAARPIEAIRRREGSAGEAGSDGARRGEQPADGAEQQPGAAEQGVEAGVAGEGRVAMTSAGEEADRGGATREEATREEERLSEEPLSEEPRR